MRAKRSRRASHQHEVDEELGLVGDRRVRFASRRLARRRHRDGGSCVRLRGCACALIRWCAGGAAAAVGALLLTKLLAGEQLIAHDGIVSRAIASARAIARSAWSPTTLPPQAPPGLPQNVKVFAQPDDGTALLVEWEAVDTDNGAPVTKYTVEYTHKEDYEGSDPSVSNQYNVVGQGTQTAARTPGLDWNHMKVGYTFTDVDAPQPYRVNITNLTCGAAVAVRVRAHTHADDGSVWRAGGEGVPSPWRASELRAAAAHPAARSLRTDVCEGSKLSWKGRKMKLAPRDGARAHQRLEDDRRGPFGLRIQARLAHLGRPAREPAAR